MLYLTRHGESQSNTFHHLNCSPPEHNEGNNLLTHRGIAQAQDYGKWLKDVQQANIRYILCSPYARARFTAFLISVELGSMPGIRFVEDLEEIHWEFPDGEWAEMDNFHSDWFEKSNDPDWQPVIEKHGIQYTVESGRQLYARAVPALVTNYEKLKAHGDVLVVCHFYTLRALLAYLDGKGPEGMQDYKPDNLCRTFYENP